MKSHPEKEERGIRANNDGQTVVEGVETDAEAARRIAEEEAKAIKAGLVDLHKKIVKNVEKFTKINTLEGVSYLLTINKFLESLIWIKENTTFGLGRIFYSKRMNAKQMPIIKMIAQYKDYEDDIESSKKNTVMDIKLQGPSDLLTED